MKLMKSVPGIGLLSGTLLLIAALAATPDAGAYYAGGGKDEAKGNDCLIGYQNVDPDQVVLDGKKQLVVCQDCDPSCDLDGVTTPNGSCTISVGVCINQSGVTGCTPPAGLDKASAKGKVKGVKGDGGKIVVDVPQLLEGSACGALVDVFIPLKETKKGAKDGKASLNLAASVKKNKSEGIVGRRDKDKLTFLCQPLPEGGSCPIPTTTTSSSTSTSTSTSSTSTSTSSTSTSTSSTSTSTSSTSTSTSTSSTSTTLVSTTSTSVESTSTSTTIPPSTSTSTITVVTTSTTTTLGSPSGSILSFRTGPPGGTCGAVRSGGAAGTVRKSLTCGGLNIGGGTSTVAEGPTPQNAPTLLNTSCAGGICTVTARTAAETGSNFNCSDTGCQFGPYLSIANFGSSTCVQNTFQSPAGGTLDANAGTLVGSFPLSSKVTLTGNAIEPCPPCMVGGAPGQGAGTCNAAAANPGAACTGINADGDSYECLPTGFEFAPFGVDLTPITTGTASFSDAGGIFCPSQANSGAFGCAGSGDENAICPGGSQPPLIDYIEESGVPAGTLVPGPHTGTLASVFCIPATGNFIIDGAANLPGPGATSLPGTLELLP
jgi:hypothetical protein